MIYLYKIVWYLIEGGGGGLYEFIWCMIPSQARLRKAHSAYDNVCSRDTNTVKKIRSHVTEIAATIYPVCKERQTLPSSICFVPHSDLCHYLCHYSLLRHNREIITYRLYILNKYVISSIVQCSFLFFFSMRRFVLLYYAHTDILCLRYVAYAQWSQLSMQSTARWY